MDLLVTLNELIPIQRPLIWFDLETTGPNSAQDRIVELGFKVLHPDGHVDTWCKYINPTIQIPGEATHGRGEYPGHGITDEMVAGSPTFSQLAIGLLRGFKNCDYGGFNVKTFDLPMLRAEFERAGHTWSYADARILDGYRLWQLGQKRTLSDAVEAFLRRKHEGAHGALSDVEASLEVVVAQLQQFQTLPHTLDQLHQLQWPRDPNAIDQEGKFVWVRGVATCNFGKKFKGTPLHLIKKDYLEWMLKDKFLEDVKFIVSEALQGRLPKQEVVSGTEV
jgi:DNA polymerase-3 subunit epsilon